MWMRWVVTYKRAGLPDLCLEGEEFAHFRAGKVHLLHDQIVPGCGLRAALYIKTHGAQLRPPHPLWDPENRAVKVVPPH